MNRPRFSIIPREMEMRNVLYDHQHVILLAFVATAALLRLLNIGLDSYWLDESTALKAAANYGPGPVLVYAFWNDAHPPLFHLLLHLWIAIGKDEATTRILPAMAGVAAVPVVYWVGCRLLDWRVGLLGAALVTISPYHILYSQELRMYTLATVISAIAVLFYWRWLRSGGRGNWALFVAASTLAAWTDQSSWLVLVSLGVHSLVMQLKHRHLRLDWVASQAVVLVVSAPAMALFYIQITRLGAYPWSWLRPVEPMALLATLQAFSAGIQLPPFLPLLSATAFCIPLAIVGLRSREVAPEILLLAAWAFLPMMLLYLVSSLGIQVYAERALLVSVPAYLLLVSYGITKTRPMALQAALIATVLLVDTIALGSFYLRSEGIRKPDLRAACTAVAETAVSRALVVHPSPLTYDPAGVYHRILGDFSAPEYMLINEESFRLWQQIQSAEALPDRGAPGDATGMKAFLRSSPYGMRSSPYGMRSSPYGMRSSPYGDWRTAAATFTYDTLMVRATDLDGLRAMASSYDRIVIVSLTAEGRQAIANNLYLTRQGWRHPLDADFDSRAALPGFVQLETRVLPGVRVEILERE